MALHILLCEYLGPAAEAWLSTSQPSRRTFGMPHTFPMLESECSSLHALDDQIALSEGSSRHAK